MYDASQKEKLLSIFKDIPKEKTNMQQLVEVLEDKSAFTYYDNSNQYQVFCEAYTIKLIQKYVRCGDEQQILLATYQLLKGYDNETGVIARRERYVREASGSNKLIKKWDDPNSSLQKIENRIVKTLVGRLTGVITDNPEEKGWLNLAEVVKKELSERFPDGLPKNLPLPSPSYLTPTTTLIKQVTEDTLSLENYDSFEFRYGDGINIDADGMSILWGDNAGGRPTYTRAQVENGILGDQIIFNTILDSPIGDEKCYVAIREDTGKHIGHRNQWHQAKLRVENGKIYILRLFVHNNNPNQEKAIAKNVKAAFSIPSESGKELPVYGFIESSNAVPSVYWHGVVLQSETAMHLEYITGTAILENSGLGANNGIKLSDDVVNAATGKVLVDYDTLDGTVSGGYKYRSFITIRIKVIYDVAYTLETQVRLVGGDKTWNNSVEAKVGDKVEIRMAYKNNDTVDQLNVGIKNVLPAGLKYILGTTMIVNAKYPNGGTVQDDNLVKQGINIGSYTAGSNAFVRFQAEVVDEGLECGSNTLVSWGQAGVNKTNLEDYATVHVVKD